MKHRGICWGRSSAEHWQDVSIFCITVLVAAALSFTPFYSALASTDMVLDKTLCNIFMYIVGAPGKTAASIGIGLTAGGALFGKISPGMCLTVLLALGGILGAAQITEFLSTGVGDGATGLVCESAE